MVYILIGRNSVQKLFFSLVFSSDDYGKIESICARKLPITGNTRHIQIALPENITIDAIAENPPSRQRLELSVVSTPIPVTFRIVPIKSLSKDELNIFT